ncbi:GGDEF domain-containing protein, partial [Streptomyces phaeochromogenes]|uniref:GGDEF domain-containing protein n=1 Tax=Streptomyces phaeochromogenes TaxID=1923 RepID=UPI0036BBAFCC
MPGSGALRLLSRTLVIAAVAVPLALAVLADDVRVRRQLHIARRDPLTGLPGRDILLDRVDRLAHSRREFLHVLVADADGLKAVNDRLGHAAGDALIAAIGRRLSTWAATRSGLAARLGGDEFGVALLMTPAAALREVLALRELLARPLDSDSPPERWPTGPANGTLKDLDVGQMQAIAARLHKCVVANRTSFEVCGAGDHLDGGSGAVAGMRE